MTGKRRSEWTTALELGSPTRADAAVHGKNHPRSIAGTVGGKERHQVCDFPGVTPGRLVDLVDGAARNIAGVIDENVDVAGSRGKRGKVVRLAQIDRVRSDLDTMFGAQLFRQRLQRFRAAGGEAEMTAFLGKGLGCRGADALRCAGNQDALAS